MTRLSALLLVLLAFGGLAACGSDGDARDRPTVGEAAPAYDARTLEGASVALADFAGEPVLLNFWATWCTPCRTETPFLQALHERYRDQGLAVVGVSMDSPGSISDVRGFVAEMGVTYRILHDPRQRGMDRFDLLGLPATFVLDRDGRIRFARIGPVSEADEDFRAVLEEVVS